MKTLKYILLSVVILSINITQLDGMKRTQEEVCQQPHKKAKSTNLAIHPDLLFTPDDPGYYTIIEQELNNLERYCFSINHQSMITRLSSPEVGFMPNVVQIELTGDHYAQSLTPMLYSLLSSKINLIAKRMGLDVSNLKIAINLDEQNGPSFNAIASNVMNMITFHVWLIKLVVWIEGSTYYHLREGLLDGIIAHELAHVFHQHNHSAIKAEFEADQTAARSLNIPQNIVRACNILYLAYELSYSLETESNLSIHDAEKLSIIYTLTSTLIKRHPDLGMLGNCPIAQFFHNIQKASEVIKNTHYPIKYRAFARNINGQKLEDHDKKVICSLIYEQLLACCAQAIPLPANVGITDGSTTHPSPWKRKNHVLNFIEGRTPIKPRLLTFD